MMYLSVYRGAYEVSRVSTVSRHSGLCKIPLPGRWPHSVIKKSHPVTHGDTKAGEVLGGRIMTAGRI